MSKTIQILFADDSPSDVELVQLALDDAGFKNTITRVDTPEAMQAALEDQPWDIVLSDFSMPHFSGLAAIETVKNTGLDLPIIIISGTVGEEVAVQSLKAGARDFFLKGRLYRLPGALEREIRESHERKARRLAEASLKESEDRFRTMADSAPAYIWLTDNQSNVVFWNRPWLDFTGLSLEALLAGKWEERIHARDRDKVREVFQQAFHQYQTYRLEFRIMRYDGQYRWILATGNPRFLEDGTFSGYIGSGIDITDMKQVQSQLEDARQEADAARELAQRADKRKSQFLANMSHELRTPLNAIIGFSEMLEKGYGGDLTEKQRSYVQNVTYSGRHLLDIVNDILDITKAEAGHIQLHYASINLRSFMAQLDAMIQEQAVKRDITLTYDIASGVDELMADASRLRQIFINLITNAIKFNRPFGKVHVSVAKSEDGQWLTCDITDNGIGIPADKINELFAEFYQVDSSYARSHEGTGLGLSLTKRLIELHQGNIHVESKINEGSRFSFKIPFLSVTEPNLAPTPAL